MDNFNSILSALKNALDRPDALPGEDAQYLMAPLKRKEQVTVGIKRDDYRLGAVMILLFPHENKLYFPLTLRHDYGGIHSGQVSLPGGKKEKQDNSLMDTAIRETSEECGLFDHDIEVIGSLSNLYIPPSNFLVHPYVGLLKDKPDFKPEEREVARLFSVSINELLSSDYKLDKCIRLSSGMSIKSPGYQLKGETVWGATAMILSEFEQLLIRIKKPGIE